MTKPKTKPAKQTTRPAPEPPAVDTPTETLEETYARLKEERVRFIEDQQRQQREAEERAGKA